jgi:hypothetical protein
VNPLIPFALGLVAGGLVAKSRPKQTAAVLDTLTETGLDRLLTTAALSTVPPSSRRLLTPLTTL